ncbi:MAG TPA: hypothetical protein VG317_18190 [Pseudonocardiaceae bacterium]|nr:hypothetical protein [Pseudonocardiaceae bacterium]
MHPKPQDEPPVEEPLADVAEQGIATAGDETDDPPDLVDTEPPAEADPTDLVEQHQAVTWDEDDYR